MKRISWLLIAVLLLSVVMPGINLAGNLVVDADTLRVAKITAAQGDVKILRAGGEKNFPAFKGMGLTQGDTIITGKDGRVTLELAEDKELKIGENSRIMISELVQSAENNADKTSLNLKAGQVYTNVKGKLSPDAKYEIRTPTAVMGVRGTQFFVSLASGGQAKVVTLEGNVFVTVPQLVTLEDGTTVTREVEIEVQPNQIFVQTGDISDPGRYGLETLTEEVELGLFVLETLQEISIQQPDLINPEILQNLEEKIEKAREEQQEQQERQQEELEQNIRYDNDTSGGSTPTTDRGNDDDDDDDRGNGNEEPGDGDDEDDDLPQLVITSQLNNVQLQLGDELPWTCNIETEPADDVELEVEVEDENIAEAYFDENYLVIEGLESGSTTVTVTASKEGYRSAVKSFTVTVVTDYEEEGDWDKSIIDDYGENTDIALDSKGMPHIIYEAGSVKYRHWNGSSWQEEEEPQIGSSQGSLAIVKIDGNEYSLISYNLNGCFGYDVFDGEYWSHQSFGDEGVTVAASSIDTIMYNGEYGTGVSYYDEENGDLYFRFDTDPIDIILDSWGDPFPVDGENSDAGKSSSLVFDEDGLAYIAYYDYSSGGEDGSLKLAVINDLLDPELDIMEVDDQVGYDDGQYVSVSQAVYNESTAIHLAYYDAVNKNLKYAMWLDEEWFIETVDDSEGDVGKYASLVLDYDGNPHISYYAESDSGGALKYARRDPEHEGEWLIEVIDQGEEVGLYSSIAFDNYFSIPHFAYTAMTGGDRVVKHATRQGIMNTIEPGVLSGTAETFEDADFLIESFENEICYVWREVWGEIDYLGDEDYIISEDGDVLTITLKSDYLNSLEYGIHKIWFYFDYGLPVLLTIDIEENLEAYTLRSNPDLAYDPMNNRYLMVYEKIIGDTNPGIWGRFISADGEQDTEFPISAEIYCNEPKVVYNPVNNNFLVTWSHYPNYEEPLIYAQILDDEGEPYGDFGNFAVCPETTGMGYGQGRPAVAVNTSNGDYLIAWEEEAGGDLQDDIYGQLLDQDGVQIGEKQTLVSMDWYQSDSVLAYSAAGNKYLLAFVDSNDILGWYIGADGVPEGAIQEIALDQNRPDEEQFDPDVVADSDGRILVVWGDNRNEDWISNIYGRFFNTDGNMEDEFIVYQSEVDQYEPSAAINTADGSCLVAWRDAYDRLYGQKFTADGTGIGEPVEIDSDGEGFGNAAIVYNPEENNYLAVYEDYNSYPHKIKYKILYPQQP